MVTSLTVPSSEGGSGEADTGEDKSGGDDPVEPAGVLESVGLKKNSKRT